MPIDRFLGAVELPLDAFSSRLSRRSFLRGGTLAATSLLTGRVASAVETGFARSLLVFDSPGPEIGADLMRGIVESFLGRGIPVAYAVDPLGSRLPNPATTAYLAEIAATEPGLVELVLRHHYPQEPGRFFEMRMAEQLRAAASERLAIRGGAAQVVTILDLQPEGEIDLPAWRSSGVHVLLCVNGSPTVETQFQGAEQVRLDGGWALPIPSTAGQIAELIQTMSGEGDTLTVLTLDALEHRDSGAALMQVEDLAAALSEAISDRGMFLTRPIDVLLHSDARLRADVALLVEDGGSETQAQVAAFTQALSAEGIPFTLAVRPGRGAGASASPACLVLANAAEAAEVATATCALLPDDGVTPPGLLASVVLQRGQDIGGQSGLKADGRFAFALAPGSGSDVLSLSGGEVLGARTVWVASADIERPVQRNLLLRNVVKAAQNGDVAFHTVEGLAADLTAAEPVLSRYWSARRRAVTDPPRTEPVAAEEREKLLDDARLAWTYIDRLSNSETGQCPGTVQGGDRFFTNWDVTLWDLGSQLQGLIAARRLDLIAVGEARARALALVRNVPTTLIDGKRLPPAVFRGNSDRIVRPDFDGCDFGRFLVALQMAVVEGIVDAGEAAARLDSWDVEAAARDRRLWSYSRRRWIDITASHCPLYLRPAFEAIGLPLDLPYPSVGEELSAEDCIRTLYAAGAIGAFGTEPILFGAVEMGRDPRSDLLAQVLFDAQLGWYESTGALRCVTEAALNVAPWFIYQGLQVVRSGPEAWIFSTPSSHSERRGSFDLQASEVVSAKAAYLWAAAYPHAQSDRLVGLMREKAKIDGLGFAVGVLAATGRPLANYTDLNTNGVILSSIATILKGPLSGAS